MARQSLLSVLLDLNAQGFENGLQKAQRSMRRTAGSMKRSGARLTKNVTAPLGLIAASSFKVAADFEQSMAKVKAVSGATASEFKALQDNARELGSSTRFAASEVSALQLEFSKLGFSADEIVKVTRGTLDLAQATGSDLASSAEVAGSTLRAFGLEASQMGRVTDVMAASFSSSALDLDSFRDSMKFVAPVAKAAGLDIETVTAMLSQLANNGVKGSSAGTALRRILSTVGATGGDVREKLKNLSQEVVTLGDAKDEVGRTAQSAFLILKEGLGDVDNLEKAFKDAEGSAGAMAATMDDTAEGALKRMQSAVEGAQITLGSALAPTVLDIVKSIEGMAQSFQGLSKSTQGFIVKAGLAAAAIGPFKSSLGGLLSTISKSQTATKLFSRSLALLSNPYTALVAVSGVLVYNLLKQAGAFQDVNRVQNKVAAISEKAQDSYRDEAAKVAALSEEYRFFQDDMEKRKQILQDLKQISPDYFGDLDAEKTKYEDLQVAVGDYMAEVKAAAIQKAFGDALIETTAEQLKVSEDLREAELRLAKAQEASAKASKKNGGSIKDGTSGRLDAQVELTAAQNHLNALTAEANALEQERLAILGKVARAEEDLADSQAKRGGGDETTNTNTNTSTGGEQTTATVPATVAFNLQDDPVGKLMAKLSEDVAAAQAQLFIDGDEVANLEAMGEAYRRAAFEAAKLGELDLAAELLEQADAAGKVDGVTQVMKALQQELGVAQLQADAFGKSFDHVGAQGQALQAAIQQLLLLGLDPMSSTIQELVAQLKGLGAAGSQMSEGLTAVMNALGPTVTSVIGDIQKANEDLAQAVIDGEMSQAEAAEESQRRKVKAARNAALRLVQIYLAESLAGVIKESFTKAPPPVAAGLAAVGVAAVNGLFNSLVKLKEGGLTTGPTLALIGDNASGKEAVIPFEKMGRFLEMAGGTSQPQHITVTGRISGKDILLTNERATDNRTRVRNF